jgi:hypothetical protein
MKNIIASLVSILWLSGCYQSAYDVFEDKSVHYEGLEYTQVAKILKHKEVRSVINVTYLNGAQPSYWDNEYENFMVGVFHSDGNHTTPIVLLNGRLAKSQNLVKKASALFKEIPFKNRFATYYHFSFDKKDGEGSLRLNYQDPNGKVTLTFEAY